MTMRKTRFALTALSALAVLCWSGAASATENDGQAYALGYQSRLSGYLPPPGFYYRDDFVYVDASRLNDQNGHEVKLAGPAVRSLRDLVFVA
jgi:hypothetical protein